MQNGQPRKETLMAAIDKKIAIAAERIARNYPIEHNGRPVPGLERRILHRIGLGRDTGSMPVVSEDLFNRVRAAGIAAVAEAWS